ncbi:MAG: caleosin family protein [bacterium]|nr:caleosin family protein [bacterium]
MSHLHRTIPALFVLLPMLTGCGTHRVPASVTGRVAAMTATPADPSALQLHVMFFDADHDGYVTLSETRKGFQRLGVSSLGSLGAAVLTHAGLRGASEGTRISVARIESGKHGSDTGIYDARGHFVQAAFERMWAFDADRSGSLSGSELRKMIDTNRTDTIGYVASRGEFGLLLRIGADATVTENGETVPALSRARLMAFYDGTLFYKLAAAREGMEPLPDGDAGL